MAVAASRFIPLSERGRSAGRRNRGRRGLGWYLVEVWSGICWRPLRVEREHPFLYCILLGLHSTFCKQSTIDVS